MDNNISKYFNTWISSENAKQFQDQALALSKNNPRLLIKMIDEMQSMGGHGLTEARAYMTSPGVLPTLIFSCHEKDVCRMINEEIPAVQQKLLRNPQIRQGLVAQDCGGFVSHIERQLHDGLGKHSNRTMERSFRPKGNYWFGRRLPTARA